MYPDLLPSLRCPRHGCSLDLVGATRGEADGDLLDGVLVCPQDGRRYPIVGGVLDLLGRTLPANPAQLVNDIPLAAWGYERLWRHRALTLLAGEPFGYRRELPFVVGLMEPQRPGLYIDVACSNGLYARAIAQARGGAPGHVVGIDHALPMVRQARRFARRAGLRISYVRASAQALPFADGAAAGVAMGGSLNEIGDMPRALAELRRTLAPTGCAVMMSLVRATSPAGRALQTALTPGGVAFPSLEQHNRLLRDARLRLVGQWRFRVVVFSWVSGKRREARDER